MVDRSHIVGHAAVFSELESNVEANNVSHAYLFSGPPSIGKLTIAKWFASTLLLRDIPEEDMHQTLRQIEKLIHPDVLILDKLWIEGIREDWNIIAKYSNIPQEHRSKTPRARSDTISIEDIRSISDRLYDTGQGKYRVLLIRSVERMQNAAANAFLKILEEPPEGRIFILTTESLSSIPDTIRSRTRILPFSTVTSKELTPLTKDIPPEDAQFLIHIAQGSPGVIQRLKKNPDKIRNERMLHTHASSFWESTSLLQKLMHTEPLNKNSEESTTFLLHLALTLQEQKGSPSSWELALRALVAGLQSNAQRQLLAQRFALATLKPREVNDRVGARVTS